VNYTLDVDSTVEFTNNDKSFVATSEYLLRLASRAKEIFESSQPAKKNRILQMLLANCTLNQKRLQLNLLKPFSGLVSDTKSTNWLTIQVSNILTDVNETNETLLTLIYVASSLKKHQYLYRKF